VAAIFSQPGGQKAAEILVVGPFTPRPKPPKMAGVGDSQ
jgi:hypothetical protein